MSPFNIIRATLFPVAILTLASACATPPPDLGLPGGGTDGVNANKGDKKGAPAKKTEPSNVPAPQGSTPPPATPQQDQAPTLASILPEAITVGQSPNGVELTLTGTRFAVGSQVDIAGTKLPATVVNAQRITVQVPADEVKQIGALRISVVAKPGLESNRLSFTVSNPTSVTIANLAPANVVLGEAGADVPLSVTGTGYTEQSVIRFNGAALPTTFSSATALKATIPAVAFVAAGRFSVTVATGTDVISLPSPFEVRNPAPAATQVTPASLTVGDVATVVTIAGSKFTKASEVFAQSAPLATTFVSPTQLRATVPSYLIAKAGTVSLVVTTGAPGGGSTTALTVTVKAGQSATPAATCAYKCADYGYKPFTCYTNWYCIGTGDNAGCLSQTPCTDTSIDVGNPNEGTANSTCQYKCSDYKYAAGECSDGYYCRYADACLVEDTTCAASASGSSASTASSASTGASGAAASACKDACVDYGYIKGECSQGYYCQYADGCLVADSSCGGGDVGGADGGAAAAASACQYDCKDYNYAPGDCSGGYYCQLADNCLVVDASCN